MKVISFLVKLIFFNDGNNFEGAVGRVVFYE